MPTLVLRPSTAGLDLESSDCVMSISNISENMRQKVSEDLRYRNKLSIQLSEKQTTVLNRIKHWNKKVVSRFTVVMKLKTLGERDLALAAQETMQCIPGVGNQTFGNRTQSITIERLSSIMLGNRTKSNPNFSVSTFTEPNRT